MTNRNACFAIGAFVAIATIYIVFFLQQTPVIQSQLRDVHPIGLGVAAAVIAYVFQRRVSQISRVDTWCREYLKVIQDLMECMNDWDGRTFPEKDRHSYAKFHSLIQIQLTSLRTLCPQWIIKQFMAPDENQKFLDCLDKLARFKSDDVEQVRELMATIKHRHIASVHQNMSKLYQ